MTLKETIKLKKDKLNAMMDNDDYVTPDMLDMAQSIIYYQTRYIDQLEEQKKLLLELYDKTYEQIIKIR